MNMEAYRAFYHVAKHGNISRASEALFITQPAVSRAIRQLEEETGTPLFFRTPRGVVLTPEGELLFSYIDQAFSLIFEGERKLRDVQNLTSGEVRMGVSDTLCKHYLIPYLKLFNTLHPGVSVQVICPTTPGIIRLLKAGKIDFGLVNMPIQDEQLSLRPILRIQDCFVAGPRYRHLGNQVQPLSVLLENPLLLLEKQSNSRIFIDQFFQSHGLNPVPAFELGNIDLLAQFARYDFGIACVIRNFITDDLDNARLFEIRTAEKLPHRSVGVACLKHVPLSAAATELIRQLEYNETSEF